MKCSICNGDIEVEDSGWGRGNNAAPVTEGRCCDSCNAAVVVPMRVRRLEEAMKGLAKEASETVARLSEEVSS